MNRSEGGILNVVFRAEHDVPRLFIACLLVGGGISACSEPSPMCGGGRESHASCAPGPDCHAGLTGCGDGRCHDIETDDANCGSCGAACEPALACHGGECVPPFCGDGECRANETATGCAEDCCEDYGYACRLQSPQCGCAEEQMCTISEARHVDCRPDGFLGPGEACDGARESCEEGTACWGEGSLAFCRVFCEVNEECGGGGSVCGEYHFADGGVRIEGSFVCTFGCDPTTSAGCPLGLACAPVESDHRLPYFTDCRPAGPAAAGDACDTQTCGSGLACVDLDGTWTCAPFCVVDESDCPIGDTCNPFFYRTVIDGVEYGYCG